jgi:hypothetical protein
MHDGKHKYQGDEHGIGYHSSGENGAARHGQRAKPVEESLTQVLSEARGRAHAGEEPAHGQETRDHEVQ